MKAKFVNESIGFKRGVDPKVSMGIGTSVIAERIKKARFAYPQNVEYIGFDQFEGRDIYIFKVLTSENFGSAKDVYYFVIPLSYDFIDDKEALSYFYASSLNSKKLAGAGDLPARAVGEKYLARKRKRIQEGIHFERSHSSADIRDKLIGTPFRPGRLFVVNSGNRDYEEAVMYLHDSEDDPSKGVFHKVGVFLKNKFNGKKSYAFYSPYLLDGSDKRNQLFKDFVRPLTKEEISLYLERSDNPSPKFQEHLEGVKKLLGMYPII